jgi:hypothetical protein
MTGDTQEQAPKTRTHSRYLVIVALTIAVLTGGVLAVNFIVDPLWFYQGNRLADYNHHFNERYSKLNVFLQDPEKYDCLILGSSTATLLNGKKIDGYTCHNVSFSRARLKEYTDYLRFMKQYMNGVKLVVVGFDGYLLVDKGSEEDQRTPAFLKNNGPLPSAFRAYIGLGPFTASIKNLLNYTVSGRYYDKSFSARLNPSAGRYRPEDEGFDANFQQRFSHALGKFDTDKLRHIRELRALAPDAKFVAYVPPIAAQYIAYLKLEKKLNGYLEAMYRSAEEFDAFYDFTVPSDFTKNPSNTNDGMHYTREINDEIAATIVDGNARFGIDVKNAALADYRRKMVEATNAFIAEGHINGYQHASAHKAGSTKSQ